MTNVSLRQGDCLITFCGKMILRLKFFCCALAVAVCVIAAGCDSGQSSLDEQKEPHFLAGKSRVASLDYKGAIEEFEKALEVNPRNASAHLELGLLFESSEPDFAAAVYHLERYLKLCPTSDRGDIVKQHVIACKQELAKTVSLAPVAQTMQRDLERLTAENRDLRQKLEAWQSYYAGQGQPPPANTARVQQTAALSQQPAQSQQRTEPIQTPTRQTSSATRTHTVQSGESPYTIARKYGVKLDALMAANPGVDARRLRPGQTLKIPAP